MGRTVWHSMNDSFCWFYCGSLQVEIVGSPLRSYLIYITDNFKSGKQRTDENYCNSHFSDQNQFVEGKQGTAKEETCKHTKAGILNLSSNFSHENCGKYDHLTKKLCTEGNNQSSESLLTSAPKWILGDPSWGTPLIVKRLWYRSAYLFIGPGWP